LGAQMKWEVKGVKDLRDKLESPIKEKQQHPLTAFASMCETLRYVV